MNAMKLFIISALAALALSSFTPYAQANCEDGVSGPKGHVNNCWNPRK
jgi:hypothetical protein